MAIRGNRSIFMCELKHQFPKHESWLDVDRRCTGIKLTANIFCLCAYVLRLNAVCLPAKYIAWAVGECKLTSHLASFPLLTRPFSMSSLKFQQIFVSATSPCTVLDFYFLTCFCVHFLAEISPARSECKFTLHCADFQY